MFNFNELAEIIPISVPDEIASIKTQQMMIRKYGKLQKN